MGDDGIDFAGANNGFRVRVAIVSGIKQVAVRSRIGNDQADRSAVEARL